ncbi:MAG: Crp/Fnr family transcriptional regulator [Acidimicrobiales bacterium]
MAHEHNTETNRLLAALPAVDRERLAPHLKFERVELKQLIFGLGGPIDCVYFPQNAVISILTTMDDDTGVEIATVGNEGMVGVPLFLGSDNMPTREFSQAQVPGEVVRMDASTFRQELVRGGSFNGVMQRYVLAFFGQTSQQVACNSLHSIEERCSRWLLLTHDRVEADEFPLTQEFLSEMLGVRLASVSVVAGVLQRAGFIRFRRGRMTVVDREGLEDSACECYRIIRAEFDRLLG